MTSATDVLEAVARGIESAGDGSCYSYDNGKTWLCCGLSFVSSEKAREHWSRLRARAAITALEPVIVEAHRAGKSNEPSHLYAARIIASLRAGGEP